MKIVVTGSLGNISKPLTQTLLQKGYEVIVISSSADKKVDIEALGAIAAIGSLQDTDFLTATFRGADVVYAMIPPNFAAADPLAHYDAIGNSYAQAIEKSGIKRVVNLSSWGAHLAEGTGMIVGSHRVEEILNKLTGVDITYIRPGSFYYNLLHNIDMIKTAGFIGTNFGGDDKLVMVSPEDIATAIVEEIEQPSTGNKVRYVASDERSCNEIASVLGAAIGKPDLKWLLFTDEQVKAAMEENHVPAIFADKLVELNAAIHSGLMREDYDLHPPAVMGKVKLEDYAQEFAAAFNAN
ncbi:NmrA family NAD(P)-binding protein [Mucilaginibacter sp.]|uniref:NmrA family NAD(P)-binding protein n=1 Tax=Mucilaginibacter sp. TaxID=1882438 RepID=UPI000CA9FD70|nr:NmrA family NAD(P)-binding protein [Mucilaginibacter sp.]PLW88901.1 MAG: NAD-dependent dehydratase [Mucilaginibacter sp.]HEK20577.1 NAD-dependent dehydratase [Bacteroidota bacterium]